MQIGFDNFLAPNSEQYESLNNYSAVVKLSFQKYSFLFAGDAETVSEGEMLDRGYNLKANLLKVGHHGSKSSSSTKMRLKNCLKTCGKSELVLIKNE